MNFQWPELYFGPINLWSAPWLGRAYEEFNRAPAVRAVPNHKSMTVPVEQIKTLTQHR